MGATLGDDVRRAFGRLLGGLAELAPLGGSSIDLVTGSGAGRLLGAGAPLLSKFADSLTRGPGIGQIKKDLRRALLNTNERQILVVLDDLDRLTPKECLEIATLVKGLADLPNTVYLLLYDGIVFDRLINDATSMDVETTFMHNIVQYSIKLPRYLRERILLSDSGLFR